MRQGEQDARTRERKGHPEILAEPPEPRPVAAAAKAAPKHAKTRYSGRKSNDGVTVHRFPFCLLLIAPLAALCLSPLRALASATIYVEPSAQQVDQAGDVSGLSETRRAYAGARLRLSLLPQLTGTEKAETVADLTLLGSGVRRSVTGTLSQSFELSSARTAHFFSGSVAAAYDHGTETARALREQYDRRFLSEAQRSHIRSASLGYGARRELDGRFTLGLQSYAGLLDMDRIIRLANAKLFLDFAKAATFGARLALVYGGQSTSTSRSASFGPELSARRELSARLAADAQVGYRFARAAAEGGVDDASSTVSYGLGLSVQDELGNLRVAYDRQTSTAAVETAAVRAGEALSLGVARLLARRFVARSSVRERRDETLVSTFPEADLVGREAELLLTFGLGPPKRADALDFETKLDLSATVEELALAGVATGQSRRTAIKLSAAATF